MDKYISLVENRLKDILKPAFPEIIYEAMGYSVFAGGKRLRPLLLLASYDAAGSAASLDTAIDFACAVEMIHCYSLIHDDLPAMDDDDFRRGKPSNHKVYGDAIAILAGDALLNTAFEQMLKTATGKTEISAMLDIARASGIGGMLGGQTADIIFENKALSKDTLMYIHTHKTGAMICASAVAGARLGGADDATLESLSQAAQKLGLAFQIKDDLLDMTSTDDVLGKPTGSDLKNHKLTYPALYGLEQSHDDYNRLSAEAASEISALFPSGYALIDIVAGISIRSK